MRKKITIEEFILRSQKSNKNQYDYSDIDLIDVKSKVGIICKKHGKFFIRPDHHMDGHGCSKCGDESVSKIFKKDNKTFIKRSKEIHGNTFDYSKTEYIGVSESVIITCKKHGDFNQKPSNHLNGQGCPKCISSKGENIIRTFLQEFNIKYEEQKKFKELKNKVNLRFDFYLSENNSVIEYHGKQHYYPIKHWGGLKQYFYRNKSDNLKYEYCKNNNIKYIEVPYFLNYIEIQNYLKGNIYGII